METPTLKCKALRWTDPLPPCDHSACTDEAEYDVKTIHGPWGYFCPTHVRAVADLSFPGHFHLVVPA